MICYFLSMKMHKKNRESENSWRNGIGFWVMKIGKLITVQNFEFSRPNHACLGALGFKISWFQLFIYFLRINPCFSNLKSSKRNCFNLSKKFRQIASRFASPLIGGAVRAVLKKRKQIESTIRGIQNEAFLGYLYKLIWQFFHFTIVSGSVLQDRVIAIANFDPLGEGRWSDCHKCSTLRLQRQFYQKS